MDVKTLRPLLDVFQEFKAGRSLFSLNLQSRTKFSRGHLFFAVNLNNQVVPRGKFDSTNQKHYSDLGSDASSVWTFCARSSDAIWRGNQW